MDIKALLLEKGESSDLMWELIGLITRIDRFDALWPSIKVKDQAKLADLVSFRYESKDLRAMMVDAMLGETGIRAKIIEEFDGLTYWNETEQTIHPLVRSTYVTYRIHCILRTLSLDSTIAIKIGQTLMVESGYDWVRYLELNFDSDSDLDISKWLTGFISIVRDGQEQLLFELDYDGVFANLTMNEQLLIYIIDKCNGITTQHIVKKLGKSEATVRRMLAKLRRLKLITSRGAGRAICHTVPFNEF